MQALSGMVIATLLIQRADDRAPYRPNIPIVAVRVSDDDGRRPATISAAQVKRWVAYGKSCSRSWARRRSRMAQPSASIASNSLRRDH